MIDSMLFAVFLISIILDVLLLIAIIVMMKVDKQFEPLKANNRLINHFSVPVHSGFYRSALSKIKSLENRLKNFFRSIVRDINTSDVQ